ncbi:uncharacterized protein LOC110451059 [Mizuhopecten yessoensis]|uniref:UPAR/Ly6 domain-containing protein n=1 Tax=Mizuhopecten yessoensis TaxID=6573 RepID=A0A210QMG5_MIZYE|nr:uncharacterized protein LOC110451059 [Mizuhopecten yessoensis]OWF49927.1 hypothetical protein KP79_PYT04017 [Mizuhopecten yessoensis]
MSPWTVAVLLSCCFVGFVTAERLSCYDCFLETDELKCNTTYTCKEGEVCYINRLIGDFYGNPCLYNLGCKIIEECSSLQEQLQTGNPSPTRIRDGDAIDYMDCCTTPGCNRHRITPPSDMCVVQN